MLIIDLQTLGSMVQLNVKSPVVFARTDVPLEGRVNTFIPKNIIEGESEKNKGPSDTLDAVVVSTPLEMLFSINFTSSF
jgi:hypothetical protein